MSGLTALSQSTNEPVRHTHHYNYRLHTLKSSDTPNYKTKYDVSIHRYSTQSTTVGAYPLKSLKAHQSVAAYS